MLVFLDIDGCLNTAAQCRDGMKSPCRCHPIDPGLMANLTHILVETGARCILTSAWRYRIANQSGIEGFEFRLRTHGFPEGKLFDYTVRDEKVSGRGNQIERWLENNDYRGPYVVIDDMAPHLESMDIHPLVTTDPDVGLTREDVEKAIRILRLPKGVHQQRIDVMTTHSMGGRWPWPWRYV